MKPAKFDYDQRNMSLQNSEMNETKKIQKIPTILVASTKLG